MVDRCIPQIIYHPRSMSKEVCSFDKARTQRGVYRNCKLPTTSTEGGVFAEYTVQPRFISYVTDDNDDVTHLLASRDLCRSDDVTRFLASCALKQN